MLTDFLIEIKNWWFGESKLNEEFDRLESKHTRVRFDNDIYELIRIH